MFLKSILEEMKKFYLRSRPAVCFGPGQRKVRKSQSGDGGLHAVGQSPGAAEPRKPGAHVTEELEMKDK